MVFYGILWCFCVVFRVFLFCFKHLVCSVFGRSVLKVLPLLEVLYVDPGCLLSSSFLFMMFIIVFCLMASICSHQLETENMACVKKQIWTRKLDTPRGRGRFGWLSS